MQQIKQIVEQEYSATGLRSFAAVYRSGVKSRVKYWLYGVCGLAAGVLFLPWTQSIRARGTVTTLKQEQRPQELNTIIAGKIIRWYVKEGDLVQQGDTIAQLAEIKDNYLDPGLLDRTREQMDAKTNSIQSYNQKISATNAQMQAMQQGRTLKLQQLQNKLQQLQLKALSDSMEAVSAANDYTIAEEQYRRQKIMRDSGLVSLVQLEQRNQSFQNTLAKKIGAGIKFTNSKTDLTNTRIELGQVEQEYAEKIYKAQGDRASAQSDIATGMGELSKLTNQYANYRIRSGQYFLLAPQSGQVTKASKAGINEIVKEGEKLVEIVPATADHAVEMWIDPVDLPLLSRGQQVRFLFDGFPAIVFSGWPEASYGTFGGRVTAVETAVSANGKFRILAAGDTTGKPWPRSLKMGTGAAGIALLKDVPVWYELWRNINGFPPDYYKPYDSNDKEKK